MKKIRNPLTAACAAIDKKLERFDPKWQARPGTGPQPLSGQDRHRPLPRVARCEGHPGGLRRVAE